MSGDVERHEPCADCVRCATCRREWKGQGVSGDVERVAAALAGHLDCWPVEEGVGYQVGWRCECGTETTSEDDVERGHEWHAAHLAEVLLAPGGVVAGMVAERMSAARLGGVEYGERRGAAEVRARVEAALARRCLHNEPECGCGMFDGDDLRAALADPETAAPATESATRAPQGVAPVSVDPGDELGPQIGAESDSEPIIRYAELDDGTEEFDEFIAHNATVHFEAMDDAQWWIGVTLPDGRSWSINCGARNSRAKGYAICEED
jgi:hypothetical protein